MLEHSTCILNKSQSEILITVNFEMGAVRATALEAEELAVDISYWSVGEQRARWWFLALNPLSRREFTVMFVALHYTSKVFLILKIQTQNREGRKYSMPTIPCQH